MKILSRTLSLSILSFATITTTAFATITTTAFAVPQFLSPNEDPVVVSEIDYARYAGVWQEVAHSPNDFQKDCERASAEYAVLTSNSLSVRNICYRADGTNRDIRGVAVAPNPAEPAKLVVDFKLPVKGDYWVVRLDSDYQWAVVSGPKKESIFILSRQSPMAPALLQTIIDDLKADGFETDSLVYDKSPSEGAVH